MSFRTQLWIAGKYVNAVKGDTFTTLNPATNLPICDVQAATKEDVGMNIAYARITFPFPRNCKNLIHTVSIICLITLDIAVAAAQACLHSPDWGYASTGAQRANILRRLGDLFTTHKVSLIVVAAAIAVCGIFAN